MLLLAGLLMVLTLVLPSAVTEGRGPADVVLVDIVDLRRVYRDALGETSVQDGAEVFAEDGRADLAAAVRYVKEQGVEVVAVYGSYVLGRADGATVAWLHDLGLRTESLAQRTRIPIGTYPFDRRDGEPPLPPALRATPPAGDAEADFLVQFLGPQKAAWRQDIAAAGGEVKAYLGRFAAVVAMTAADREAVRALPFVEWTGLYHPGYKVPPGLLHERGEVEIVVGLFPGYGPRSVAGFVQDNGGTVNASWSRGLHVRLNAEDVPGLAHLPSVSGVRRPDVPQFLNDEATAILQSGTTTSRPLFALGLRGQGQLLTLADSGINDNHEMFYDGDDPIGSTYRKIEAYEAIGEGDLGDEIGHGTHVAGTLAGDAPTYDGYDGYDGHAFAARLYVQDIGGESGSPAAPIEGLYDPMFQLALDKGSWIHSNSWGSWVDPDAGNGTYDYYARDIDRFVNDFPKFSIVFAVGNKGDLGDNTVSSTAHSKNAIIVGALAPGSWEVSEFNSRGLTDDGRISPTVVAPGTCIVSARKNTSTPQSSGCAEPSTDYVEFSGTSMAAPAVAGSVALLRQYLMEGWYPTGAATAGHEVTPTAALLKALLVNSGFQLRGSEAFEHFAYFPNGDQGWGRPYLDHVLYFAGESQEETPRKTGWRTLSPGLAEGETLLFQVEVTSDVGPMNVALVWTDPPAEVDCTDCLRNDLDLELRSPGGFWYHGNRYECAYAFPDPPPYESCEHSYVWQLTPDRKNNVETFYAHTPPTGTWEVRVKGAFVTDGPTQPFALVATGYGLAQSVGGIVEDTGGSPLQNAEVALTGVQNSYTTTTDADGRFSVNAAPDAYTMTTTYRCEYETDSRAVTSDPGFHREETVVLAKRGLATVYGTVKDDAGQALGNVKVEEQCTHTYAFTDGSGSYSLGSVPGGTTVQIVAEKPGYFSDAADVNVPAGGSQQVDFTLAEKPTCGRICPDGGEEEG